jgi:peptidoglycan/LPS O-acetylase OafA/YrhL
VLKGHALWQIPVDYAIVVAVVAGLSAITYLVVERPALRLRRPLRRLAVPAKAGILAAEAPITRS